MKISKFLPSKTDITKQLIIAAVVVTVGAIVLRTFPGIRTLYQKDEN
jgi:hypothetical protein